MIDARQAKWMREKLEWVFGLFKEELGAEPWDGWEWWYEGPPKEVYNKFNDEDRLYRTLIMDATQQPPPEDIEGWKLVDIYPNSGNVECPGGWMGNGTVNGSQSVEVSNNHWLCPLCESARGQQHGIIHIGSGFVEALYTKDMET